MKLLVSRALALVLVVVALVLVPATTLAAEPTPGVVSLSGPDGRITAWPARHRAEVSIEGYGSVVFENARVLVKPQRITITARTPERTLDAWINRTNNFGAVGLVVRGRDRPRRAETHTFFVTRLEIDGVARLARH